MKVSTRTRSPLLAMAMAPLLAGLAHRASADPVLGNATYLGGSGGEVARAAAVDGSGNIVVVGETTSTDLPMSAPWQAAPGGGIDVFVSKLDPTGQSLVFSTYVGGSGDEQAAKVAVDPSGNVYVGGKTASANFPLVNAYQAGGWGFVVKLTPAGVPVYSTRTTSSNQAVAVSADATGAAFITSVWAGSAFVRKLDASGSAIIFETAVSMPNGTAGAGNTVDAAGATYLTGTSNNLLDTDVLVAKVDPAGTLVWSKVFGGYGDDGGTDIAIDASGNSYVTGYTMSAGTFSGAIQPTLAGDLDAFVMKLDGAGNVVYRTYLGGDAPGADSESGGGITTDAAGNAYVAGSTNAKDFPIRDALDPSTSGQSAFIAKIDTAGASLVFSTFLGGEGGEWANDVALDPAGRIVVAGEAASRDFPVVAAYQPSRNGPWDAAVARIDDRCGKVGLTPVSLPPAFLSTPYIGTVSASGGVPPYTYGVVGGALPPGMGLSPVGVLTGTPTSTGFFNVTVRAADALGCEGAEGYYIPVCSAPLLVSPPGLPDSVQGASYSETLSTTGGLAPYSYATTSGVPPTYSFLGFSGELSGLMIVPGASTFEATATDAEGCTGTRSYTIRVCGRIELAPVELPAGRASASYSASMSASFGVAPYQFALSGGALPPGLSLSSSGIVSGIPAAAGTFTFTVGATDAVGCAGSQNETIVVGPAGCSIVVAPGRLPRPAVGIPYQATLSASGGAPPYQFAIGAGTLPGGLTLSAGGVISGTTSSRGHHPLAIQVTDAGGCTGVGAYELEVGDDVLVGPGPGPANPAIVMAYDANARQSPLGFYAYAASDWGTNVAAGDVDGAGHAEIVTGPGPGPVYGPQVRAFRRDGVALQKINFYAYATLKYGTNVSARNVDGDPYSEIVTGAGPGGVFGPHVRGWNYDGTVLSVIAKISYFAYGTPRFGVNVAGGDVDGDGSDEILTGPGPSPAFGPLVRGWNYDGFILSSIGKINFLPFAVLQYGVREASADVDLDGYDELACANGPGPTLDGLFLGYGYDGASIVSLPGFMASESFGYGGRIAMGDVVGDAADDLVYASGPNPYFASSPWLASYDGTSLLVLGRLLPPFASGVDLGAGDLGL